MWEIASNYLTEDPTYPLTRFYIKEFDHYQNGNEVILQKMFGPARNPIKCEFGLLKNKAIDFNKGNGYET